ncbi:MAG: TIGR04002 family protein [Ruminococcaceae bacterium]|nr:TIGR04002 family protein [Oscillospiraceae bacterium]
MKATSLQRVVITAVFAAIICATTAFLFHIPVGTAGGYIHLGDAFIYLAGAFLPTPYAMAAAGIGSALADVLTGAPHWALFTVIIKTAMAACFTSAKSTVLCRRNVIAAFGAGVICIVGYYVAEVILFGNWIAPLLTIPTGGLVQSGGGLVLFLIVGAALDRADFKAKIRRNGL